MPNAIWVAAFCALIGVTFLIGCSSESNKDQPLTARQRQDMMLADPGGYKPEPVDTDITGGSTGHFDKKAFNRDMDHVFNP